MPPRLSLTPLLIFSRWGIIPGYACHAYNPQPEL